MSLKLMFDVIYHLFFPVAHPTAPQPSHKEPPSDDSSFSVVKDLKRKGSKLDHATIQGVLSSYEKNNKNPQKYVVQRIDETDIQKPFVLGRPLKSAKGPPKGLCLSIHRNGHYAGFFVDIKRRKMVYYDSLGLPMHPELQPFFDQIKDALFTPSSPTPDLAEDHTAVPLPPAQIIDCRVKHQNDTYNCGRYVIHFLRTMASSENLDQTIETFCSTKLSEEKIYEQGCKWAQDMSSAGRR